MADVRNNNFPQTEWLIGRSTLVFLIRNIAVEDLGPHGFSARFSKAYRNEYLAFRRRFRTSTPSREDLLFQEGAASLGVADVETLRALCSSVRIDCDAWHDVGVIAGYWAAYNPAAPPTDQEVA